ncbi:helix-turn-helix domain-containing protein [Acinetobacter nosocomialis]|uniref:helix-turn-helix domain-containing protein n=1 Tax=Acinetobacter TaxID=469 RepID=UPI0004F57E17|nr:MULTISPECIES: helix-turn-helix transcriptional regulator [Acinetobacter]MBJ8463269.1 helix-turn-helix transcriptional regulator [Acinetobacter nosocomialis]MBO3652620.1 helix-turn-helix transcriptional regulator [Acinetobacter bereziniae]MBP1499113.1 helix-turn-helix transcriptional regulator [Acinetobacter nosocomialis]MCG9289942.1 helix-turn-helix domain-containing protein [Acinetobacter nosocomialis]MCU4537523.1 helix-turn-helix domain-containing protein [Acinetobacter bereziniae]
MTTSIYTNEVKALTNWLKQARQDQKFSMRALAERMDKPHSFVQKVEQGERRLDVVEYVWYCRKLGVNPQDGLLLIEQMLLESQD